LLETAKKKYDKIEYINKLNSMSLLKNKEFLYKLINKKL
jgi:hypothetical protein